LVTGSEIMSNTYDIVSLILDKQVASF